MIGTVDIRARPVRLAYLVDPGNRRQVREAVRLSSTLWGGTHFPIIPMHRRMPSSWREQGIKTPTAKAVILGYLDAFDPDFLVLLCKEVPVFISAAGRPTIQAADIWKTHRDGQALEPTYGIGIFEILEDVFEKFFKYKRKYPIKVVLPRLPAQYGLFWATMFGEIHPEIAETLEKRYAEPVELAHVDVGPDSLKTILNSDMLFPRRLSQHGLERHGRKSRIRGDARVYFLDATSVEDLVDFWNLRALGGPVLPLPKQFKDEPHFREVLEDFLRTYRRPWRHNPAVCDVASIIRSRHSTMTELQEVAKGVRLERDSKDPSKDGFFTLQHWYPRIWDEWARDKDGAIPDDWFSENGASVDVGDRKDFSIHFNLVLPPFAERHGIYSEARCANEIVPRFYGAADYAAEVIPPPSGSRLERVIGGAVALPGQWRVGRNGLVTLVQFERSVTRTVPSGEDVVFAWLADKGWEARLSPPGLLAKEILRRCEGYINSLANPKVLGLLEYMNGGKALNDGTPVEEETSSEERQLPVGEVKNKLRGSSQHGDLHAYLLSRGVFQLGLKTQCPHCTRRSWYSLDGVRDELSCPRCLSSFPAVGNLNRAHWCYKTVGPFSVPGYADGAYGVLLALRCFDEPRMTGMRMSPALSFVAKKEKEDALEADFALFWQETVFGEQREGLMFAECKTFGRFEARDFARMRRVATTFPGAVLTFSTLRTSLTQEEIRGIARIARTGRKYWKPERPINPVLVLTGTEILEWQGPPYCWDAETQARFRNLHGLLELCDATQQLYLKLPSWHADWHERWERRSKRHKERREAAAQKGGPGA